MSRTIVGRNLADFTVGLTDVSPTARAPPSLAHSDYRLCGHYEGTVPDGQTITMMCVRPYPTGQFLFVLRRGQARYLQLCELEVYPLIGRCDSSTVEDISVFNSNTARIFIIRPCSFLFLISTQCSFAILHYILMHIH